MKVKVKWLSRVRLFATLWTVAFQAPLSMGFSRQESWSGLPFPSPGDLPDPGIEPRSPALQADALPSEPPGKPKKASNYFPFPCTSMVFSSVFKWLCSVLREQTQVVRKELLNEQVPAMDSEGQVTVGTAHFRHVQ